MKKNLFIIMLLPLLIIGCGTSSDSGSSDDSGEQQHRPAARAQVSGSAFINSKVQLADGGSFDTDNDISDYQWYDHRGNKLATDTNGNAEWTAPSSEGQYTLEFKVSDVQNNSDTAKIKINVLKSDELKSLIGAGGTTYICVGDSTREMKESGYDGGHVFQKVWDTLNNYNVTSYLYAKHGYTARNFNNEKEGTVSFDWHEIRNLIPGNGSTTIVDITLGINDVRYYEDHDVYNELSRAILKIKREKSQTKFLLTMPNKIVSKRADFAKKSSLISQAYFRLSQDLGLPIIDTMGELFSGAYDDSMYRSQDGVEYAGDSGSDTRIHLSLKGQEAVADLILERLLP